MRKNKSLLLNIVTVVMIVVAFVIGFRIYQTSKEKPLVNSTPATSSNQTMSAEEKVLVTPPQTATEQEKKDYEQLVISLAKDAPIVDIANCIADPVVWRIKDKQAFTMKNSGDKEHRIIFYNQEAVVIPPKKEQEVEVNFQYGYGVYAYGCDNSPNPVGILLVTE